MWAFLWGSIWMVFTPVTFSNNWPYHLFYLWALYFALWFVQVFTSIFAESFRVGDRTGVARGLRVYFGITRAPWLTYLIILLVSSLLWLRSFLMLTPFLYLACLLWSEYVFNKASRAGGLAREGELHTAGQVNAGRAGTSGRKQQWAWVVGRQAMTGNDAVPDFAVVKRPAKSASSGLFDDDLKPAQTTEPSEARGSTSAAKKPADASTVAASVIAFLKAKPNATNPPEPTENTAQNGPSTRQSSTTPATDSPSSVNPRLARRAHLNAPNSSQIDLSKATGER